jgi:proteasome lid subunit RPN8/RPN11
VTLQIPRHLMGNIHDQGELAYPEEGAGFLLGEDGDVRVVKDLIVFANAREDGARHNRYLIGPEQYRKAETEAEHRQLDLVGIFHSHPDHPNSPSEFDREWAQPLFTYIITSVESGRAIESRAWRLAEDRSQFTEEEFTIID